MRASHKRAYFDAAVRAVPLRAGLGSGARCQCRCRRSAGQALYYGFFGPRPVGDGMSY